VRGAGFDPSANEVLDRLLIPGQIVDAW